MIIGTTNKVAILRCWACTRGLINANLLNRMQACSLVLVQSLWQFGIGLDMKNTRWLWVLFPRSTTIPDPRSNFAIPDAIMAAFGVIIVTILLVCTWCYAVGDQAVIVSQLDRYIWLVNQSLPAQRSCFFKRIDAILPMWSHALENVAVHKVRIQEMLRQQCDGLPSSLLAAIEAKRFDGCDRKNHQDKASYLDKLRDNQLFLRSSSGAPNCRYDVQVTEEEGDAGDDRWHWSIHIKQHSCLCANDLYAGGSSFQVLSEGRSQHLQCRLAALSNDSYTFHCSVIADKQLFHHIDYNASHAVGLSAMARFYLQQQVLKAHCLNLTVILHFEAFDAFHEGAFTSLGHVIYSREHCASAMRPPALHGQPLSSWQSWLSKVHDTAVMRPCIQAYSGIRMIGASHLRYVWDVLVHKHSINGSSVLQQLVQKHEAADSQDMSFRPARFMANIPSELLQYCDAVDRIVHEHIVNQTLDQLLADPPRHHIVVQAGAWDLYYTPLTYVVASEVGWKSVSRTLRAISHRHCSRFMSISWLPTVPAPMIAESAMHSKVQERFNAFIASVPDHGNSSTETKEAIRKKYANSLFESCLFRGYRINHAIEALSSTVQQEIDRIAYPAEEVRRFWADSTASHGLNRSTSMQSRLQFVDTFLPMMAFNDESADRMHYLMFFQEESTVIKSTLAGEILLARIGHTLCDAV